MFEATAIMIITLVICLALGLPIYISLGAATVAALVVGDITLLMIPQTLFRSVDNFPLLAIPCFILAGTIMEHSGITDQIISVVRKPLGRTYGGLGIATILACMFFAAITGSGPGTVAAVGAIMVPAMLKQGYGKGYTGAIASSGGTLGILIPPSNPMIIYGVLAECSITGLFIAGMVPGIMIGAAHCLVAWYVARRNGYKGEDQPFDVKDFVKTCWHSRWALASPIVILGGIYGGIFTPVEASVVAVFWALFVGGVVNRKLSFNKLMLSLQDGVMIAGTVIIIVGTSTLFGQMLSMAQVPSILSEFILSISNNWFIVMLMLIALFYALGMFMETLSTIIILTPVLLPVVTSLGIHPIHFGIILVVTNEVAFLTPPLGVNLFVASKMVDTSLEKVSIHALPHVAAITICIILLTYFKGICLWLPKLLGYGTY